MLVLLRAAVRRLLGGAWALRAPGGGGGRRDGEGAGMITALDRMLARGGKKDL